MPPPPSPFPASLARQNLRTRQLLQPAPWLDRLKVESDSSKQSQRRTFSPLNPRISSSFSDGSCVTDRFSAIGVDSSYHTVDQSCPAYAKSLLEMGKWAISRIVPTGNTYKLERYDDVGLRREPRTRGYSHLHRQHHRLRTLTTTAYSLIEGKGRGKDKGKHPHTSPVSSPQQAAPFRAQPEQRAQPAQPAQSADSTRLVQPVATPTPPQPVQAPPPTPSQPTPLTPERFHLLADLYIDRLIEDLEELQEEREDVDFEFSAGVLTLDFPPNGTYVLNKQPPNRQIWLSSPVSGPKRFDWVELPQPSKPPPTREELASQEHNSASAAAGKAKPSPESGKGNAGQAKESGEAAGSPPEQRMHAVYCGGVWTYLRDGTFLTDVLEEELKIEFGAVARKKHMMMTEADEMMGGERKDKEGKDG